MTSPISTKKAAPANSPMPVPPFLTLTWSSDLASWISLWIRVETSRVASETSRPIVGSVSLTGSFAIWLRAPWSAGSGGSVVPTLQRPGRLPPGGADAASLTGESRGTSPARLRAPDPSEGQPVSVERRMLPLPEPGETRFLADLLRSEPVGGLLALDAAVVALIWANSPWDAAYQSFIGWDVGPARSRALGGRRGAHAVLLRGRAGAEAGVRGRVAAQARRRGGAGGRGAVRGRRTGSALHARQRGRSARPDRRLGDPGGDRHRLRARGARRRRAHTCRRRCGRSC